MVWQSLHDEQLLLYKLSAAIRSSWGHDIKGGHLILVQSQLLWRIKIDREDRRSILSLKLVKENEALPFPWVIAGTGRLTQGHWCNIKSAGSRPVGRDCEALMLAGGGEEMTGRWSGKWMGWSHRTVPFWVQEECSGSCATHPRPSPLHKASFQPSTATHSLVLHNRVFTVSGPQFPRWSCSENHGDLGDGETMQGSCNSPAIATTACLLLQLFNLFGFQ